MLTRIALDLRETGLTDADCNTLIGMATAGKFSRLHYLRIKIGNNDISENRLRNLRRSLERIELREWCLDETPSCPLEPDPPW